MRIVGNERMLFIKSERTDKCICQFGKEVKRPPEKRNMTADRFSACKPGDRLIDYGLEDRCGKIFFCRTVVYQRLYIGFGEYTASCGYGIKTRVGFCVFIESRRICHQKSGHLVYKRAGTAGTNAVHALLDVTVFKINDLGILTAEFYGNIGIGCDL